MPKAADYCTEEPEKVSRIRSLGPRAQVSRCWPLLILSREGGLTVRRADIHLFQVRPSFCSHAEAVLASTWADQVSHAFPLSPIQPWENGKGFASQKSHRFADEIQEWIPLDQIAHQVPSQPEPGPNVPTAAHSLSTLRAQHPWLPQFYCPLPRLLSAPYPENSTEREGQSFKGHIFCFPHLALILPPLHSRLLLGFRYTAYGPDPNLPLGNIPAYQVEKKCDKVGIFVLYVQGTVL